MIYNDMTRHHFETAVNAGVLSSSSAMRRGAAGSRAQGTWVQFDVQFAVKIDRGNRGGRGETVAAVRFLAYACPHVIAVADWIATHAVGGEAKAFLPEGVAALRQRFAVPVEKLGRLLIVEDAWIAAISPPPT